MELRIAVYIVLVIVSSIGLLIHLWKFYKNMLNQISTTRNLAFYCSVLLANYAYDLIKLLCEELFIQLKVEITSGLLAIFLQALTTFFFSFTLFYKWVIIVEILVFVFSGLSTTSQETPTTSPLHGFFIYGITGIVLSLGYTVIVMAAYVIRRYHLQYDGNQERLGFVQELTAIIVRIVNLITIPIIFILRRSRVVGATDRDDFSVEKRLLLLIAAYSILLLVVKPYYWIFVVHPSAPWYLKITHTDRYLEPVSFALEGIVIVILFTFLSDTFRHVGSEETVTAAQAETAESAKTPEPTKPAESAKPAE